MGNPIHRQTIMQNAIANGFYSITISNSRLQNYSLSLSLPLGGRQTVVAEHIELNFAFLIFQKIFNTYEYEYFYGQLQFVLYMRKQETDAKERSVVTLRNDDKFFKTRNYLKSGCRVFFFFVGFFLPSFIGYHFYFCFYKKRNPFNFFYVNEFMELGN